MKYRFHYCSQRLRLGDVAVFENRQPVTAAKFITKCSLFILMLGVIRRLEPQLNSKQKAENIFVARHIAKPPVVCRYFSFHVLSYQSLLLFIANSKSLSKVNVCICLKAYFPISVNAGFNIFQHFPSLSDSQFISISGCLISSKFLNLNSAGL